MLCVRPCMPIDTVVSRLPSKPLAANSMALAGRASGFLLIAWASSRSSDWGTSARPVVGGGLERMRGMSA